MISSLTRGPRTISTNTTDHNDDQQRVQDHAESFLHLAPAPVLARDRRHDSLCHPGVTLRARRQNPEPVQHDILTGSQRRARYRHSKSLSPSGRQNSGQPYSRQ
jgi:hypothetical protein